MSRLTPSRATLGNLAVIALLLVAAALLLRLHLGEDWWPAPPLARHWQWAAATLAAYTAGCAALWWRNRPRADQLPDDGPAPVLVAWASQTGFACDLAQRTADALRASGLPVRVRAIDRLDAATLAASQQALFIASTTGEGDAPDHAAAFVQGLMASALSLSHLQYGVLALGDRSYQHYCAFGHRLDDWLRQRGAHRLFDTLEVDNADPATLRHWKELLGQLGGDASAIPDWTAPQYQRWRLQQRRLLNPGSVGAGVHLLSLVPADGALPAWEAGDIAEIGPRNAPQRVEQWLAAHSLDGDAMVAGQPLREWLSRSHLPGGASADPAALVAALEPLPHRAYSIASVPADGDLQLLLRLQRQPDGTPGLGSGWLCEHAVVGSSIDLRLRANPAFHPPAPTQPLVLVGNGTGIAGLRAQLRARIEAGARRNWLVFGERNAAHDFHFGDELRQWQADGWIERLDVVFSRDGDERRYVQHALAAASDTLRQWVDDGATVMVCGSLQGMAPGVDAVIEQTLGVAGKEQLILQGRYRRDVY